MTIDINTFKSERKKNCKEERERERERERETKREREKDNFHPTAAQQLSVLLLLIRKLLNVVFQINEQGFSFCQMKKGRR